LPSATAIIAGAPNLANAQAFIDFLISDEGQEIVASLTNRPVNINIPNTNPNMLPFSQINLAFDNIQYTADNRTKLQQRWLDLAAKYGA
jgi:iron(III) transport system substrate-binding protein